MARSKPKIIVGVGYFSLSGVHVFAIHLVRGLCGLGFDAELLMTEQETDLVSLPPEPMTVPSDIPVTKLPVARDGKWRDHWVSLLRYCENAAPCVYLPNVDFRHSCVSPRLSRRVAVVGVLQGDDPVHYEHAQRLGPYWDAIVGVSDELTRRTGQLVPSLAPRLVTIPNAVPVPTVCPSRPEGDRPLKVIYHGVLNTYQKRILDIPLILNELVRRGARVELTIAGSGPEREELLSQCQPYLQRGMMRYLGIVPHSRIETLLLENDVYLLTSKFEGMPHAMLEAMGQGCVPVVTDIASGVPEVVRDGVNGYRVPIGDVTTFADRLEELSRDPLKRQSMACDAHRAIRHSPFNVSRMVQSYAELFDKVLADSASGRYRRPPGLVMPPPAEVAGLSIFPVDYADDVADVERILKEEPIAHQPSTNGWGRLTERWRQWRHYLLGAR